MKFTFDSLFPGLPEWIKEKTKAEEYINDLDGFLPKLRKYITDKSEITSIVFDDVSTFNMVFQVKRPKLKVESSPTCAILAPCICKIIRARAYVKTVPTGASIKVDVNKNGTTVFTDQSHRAEIAISAHAGTTTDFDISTVAKDDIITIDVDQVGSGTAGADLVLQVACERD